MDYFGNHVGRLIDELSKLPGIGNKTAQRLAFHIIGMPEASAENLAKAIVHAKRHIKFCSKCYTLTDDTLCPICKSSNRDQETIMVVEASRDMAAYEKTRQYKGLYHVLHGAISPLLNVGPNDIKVRELLLRLEPENTQEVILATNSSVEGEATAVYLSKLIKPSGIKVTRIANGVPVGGDLEYVDEITLSRALEGRVLL
ncbi:recA filament-DNA complex stabilisation factor [Petrocella atlantisensis]|uniref:Recombination protein RecR n=1 Tax=Petrocella atlantisensis TaxID=2173034 RepID=A0A3P7RY27_9FIRM|nr:recombination mediator RecR [Petrocella atlantisensis]PKM54811.1 MAG: recombination protein RecR [Firmicutes bacterium HGW-Firmicutes-5]VDN47656.1 recA filament-DNA complex stabilisation factor [Petrocella atlantisensis]